MMHSTADRVWQSYQRCAEDYTFLHDFYQRFVDASPDVQRLFAHTDMDHQVLMLRASLELMLGEDNAENSHQDLQRVARLHGKTGINVPPRLFDVWLESLVATVQAYDQGFDTELEQAWREVLKNEIAYMKSFH